MEDSKEWIVPISTNRFLGLPHNILLQILQLLPRKTVYEACFVHHDKLLPEAKSVLWEAPRFQSGLSAIQFFNTVRASKRLGLLVRSLYLCVPTTEHVMFPILNQSSLTVHQQQDTNSMSDPKLILLLTKACEKITSLTIYSDKIESAHIEQVAATAINLTSLTLLGSKIKDAPYINGLLSRIQCLTLDGKFVLTDHWATLMQRATELTSLQIPLMDIALTVLDKLCRNIPQLTSLTLTDASGFKDSDVKIVTSFFPRLKSFVLQGSVHVTEAALFHALSSCPDLQHLKLRANVNRDGHPAKHLERFGTPPDHLLIPLQTLVLENIMMDDVWCLLMSSKLKQLKYVGLKSCPNVTGKSVEALLKHCHHLAEFWVVDCPLVPLSVFADVIHSCPSLRRISFERSGPLTTSDIYHLCETGKLFMLRVSATPQLKTPAFSSKVNADNVIELDKQDIEQVARGTQSKPTLTTDTDCVLTADHVSQLAQRLGIPIDTLNSIINDITGRIEIFGDSSESLDYSRGSSIINSSDDEEEEEEEEDVTQSSPTKSSNNSFISQEWLHDFDEKAVSETDAAYSEDEAYTNHASSKDNFSQIPDWADNDQQLDWPDQTNANDNTSNVQGWPASETWVNEYNQYEPVPEPVQSDDTWNDDDDDDDDNESTDSVKDWSQREMQKQDGWTPDDDHNDNIPTLANWQSQINNNGNSTNENAEEWPLPGEQKPLISKSSTKTKNAWENIPHTIRGSKTRMSHQTNVYNAWNPQAAEAEVRQLTGTAMSGQHIKAKQLGHGRTQPRVMDEGWGGTPDNYRAWDDVDKHGYNQEVLDKQKNTVYWRMENGVWKECDQGLAETSTNAGEAPPMNSPGRTKSRRRADSYQSSADSYTEDRTRNKPPRDARLTPDSSKRWLHDKYEGGGGGGTTTNSTKKSNDNIPDWHSFKDANVNNGNDLNEARHSQKSPNNQWHGSSSNEGPSEQSFFPKNSKKFTKNNRNTRKTRQNLPPGKMAGQWGDLFGQEASSPEQNYKPQSPQQTDASLVDIIDEFSPNRMNEHENMHSSVINDLSNIFDGNNNNNQSDPKDVMDFTNLLGPEKEDPPVNSATAEVASPESPPEAPFNGWNSTIKSNSNSRSHSSNSNSSMSPNDTHIPTLESVSTTTNNNSNNNNNNNNTPVSPSLLSSAPSSPPSSGSFTTKLKVKVCPNTMDIIYINKDNVREQIAGLMHQYDLHDEVRLEKMVADATSLLVKRETDNVFKIKKKKSKLL